jgi:hypothetical protein
MYGWICESGGFDPGIPEKAHPRMLAASGLFYAFENGP